MAALALSPGLAVTVRDSRVAGSVDEQTCSAPSPVATFQSTSRQVFLWFVARQIRTGDQLRVEWLDPSGAISTTANYADLPNASEVCFTTRLPIAGFAP